MMSEHATACSEEGGVGNGPALGAHSTKTRDQLIRAYVAGLPRIPMRKHMAEQVNPMLAQHGYPPLEGGSIYRIVKYGRNITSLQEDGTPKRRMTPRKKHAQQRQATSTALRNSIRRNNEIHQYESMMNAPANKLNNPLIRRAEEVQHLLVELSALDPAVAVTQIPIDRCRQWTPEFAEWWWTFTQLCEERRTRETPNIPPMSYPRRRKLDHSPDRPTEEYQVSPSQASVLAWLRTRTLPVTAVGVANEVKLPESSAYTALTRLCALGLVSVDATQTPYKYTAVTTQ